MARSQGVICRPSLRIALVALLVIVPNSFAAPRQISPNPSVCAPSCKSSQDVKLRYEGGKTYIYDFVSESVTRIIGSSDESSDLKVKGQVVLEAQSQCDFVLTVKDATVQNPSGKVSGMDTLTGSSIRFAYQDGTVEELCVGENDPTWSANIKRGLVSMLQNQALKNMGKSVIVEADISGRCPTQYVVEGDRYVKSRDLLGCSNREDSKLLHHGVRYDLPSRTKSLPVASSNMSCVQDMREGVVQTVSCKESHMLNAFKKNENGAQTTVISTLVLQSVQSGSFKRSSVNYVPSSIFYDHSDTLQGNIARNGVSQTRAVLDALCKDMEASSFSSEAPDYFLQLKKAISFVSYDDLREIYDGLDSGNLCRQYSKTLKKMLVDAAIQSGSDGPIALVFNLFDNVEENVKKSFYAQVTFAPRPGPQALDAVSKVLKKQSTPEVAVMLAASGMAHQYCKNTNADCVHNQEYVELVSILARHASSYCLSADSSEVEKAIGALQALGNLDALTSEAVAAIRQCMTGNDRVQVRALDASRRDPCNPTLKQNAKDVFANVMKASNVRIQGYMAMTKCMEPADVETIQSVMNKEKSSQVISYVASHIRNKIRSAKPDKPEVYAMLPEVRFPRSVPQDLFKYSKHLEQSFMSRANDFGGSLDGNIVYSPSSYMPRSASANATIFALGRAFNFLEVGIYAENFESAFERFYKSRGSDRSSRYVWGGKRSNYLRSSSGDQSPPLYNIDSEMEPIWEQAGTTPRVSSVGYGDIYVRVHGTSILVSTLKENQLSGNTLWAKAPLDHSSRTPADIKFTESASVDEEIVYPTITGMPLKFGVALSSVVDLEVSSTTSSATFFDQGSRGSTFRAHVVPRAASLIRGRMSIAAGPYESGVQLEGKVHSTTGVDLDLTNQKNTFDFKLAFPENKVHLTELRNELFWVQTQPDEVEKKTPVKTNAEKVVYSKSTRPSDCYASQLLGLKLCADITFPRSSSRGPSGPLLGPSIWSIAVEKTDNAMQGYHAHVETQLEGPNRFITAFVDTPGSSTNRKIEFRGRLNTGDVFKAEANIDSPWKKAGISYLQENTMAKKSAILAVSLDDDEYKAMAQVDVSGAGSKKMYKPTIRYSTPTGSHQVLTGSVEYAPNQKIRAVLQTEVGNYRMLNGKADIQVEYDIKDAYEYQIVNNWKLDYPAWGLGTLGHTSTLSYSDYTWDFVTDNTFLESAEKHHLTLKVYHFAGQEFQVISSSNCSYCDYFNYQFGWTLKKDRLGKSIENNFDLKIPRAYKSRPLVVKQHSKFATAERNGFDVQNSLKVSAYDTDIEFVLNGKHIVDKSHDYQLRLHSGDSHKFDFKIEAGPEIYFNYNVIATLQYPGQYYELNEVAKQVGDYTWQYDSKFIARPGATYDAVSELVMKDERNDMEKTFTTTVRSNKWTQPRVFKTSLKKENIGITALVQYDAEGQKQVNILTSYKQIGLKPDTVKMVAFVRDYIDAQLTGTRSRTTSTLEVLGTWVPTNRVVKLDSEYKAQGEKMALTGELQWDAERDPSKKARINSNTLFTSSSSFESTNEFNLNAHTSNLNLKVKRGRSMLDGENLLDAQYHSSDNTNLKVYVQHVGETKPRSVSSKLVAKSQYMQESPYELEWDNRFANFDSNQMTFEIFTDVKAASNGEDKLQLHVEANSLYPPGSVRTMNGNLDVSGALVSTPFSLEYNTEYKGTALKATMSSKYGKKVASLTLSGKFDRFAPKKTAEISYSLNLPVSPKTISGTQSFTYIFDSWNHMEVSESGSLSIDSQVPHTWTHMLHSMSNDFKIASSVSKQGHNLWNVGISGRKDRKRVALDLVGKVRDHGLEFHSNVEGRFPYYNIRSNGSYEFGSTAKAKAYSYSLNHRSAQGGQTIETDLTVDHNSEKFALSNKLENYAKRKSVDLLFTDGSVPRKLYLLLLNNAPKWSVESYAKWGEAGNTLSSKGSLEYSADLFDASVSIDSPRLKMDKWSARASQKSTKGRKSVAFSIEGDNQQILNLGVDYAKKTERAGDVYDGSVNVAARKSRYTGTFRVENVSFNKKRDGESGSQVRGEINLSGGATPMKFNVTLKNTDLQKQFSVLYCHDSDTQCRSGNVVVTHDHEEDNNLHYEVRATTEATQSGKRSSVDGFFVKTSKIGKDFVHEANVIISEEQGKPLGYRFHKKDGQEYGFDLNLPERIVSGMFVRDSKPGHEHSSLSIWTDKERKPSEKLTMAFNYDNVGESSSGVKGAIVSATVKHPSLPQNMRVFTKFLYGGEETKLDFVTDIAMFKQNSKITWVAKINRAAGTARSGSVWNILTTVNSSEPRIFALIKSEYREAGSALSVETQYSNRLNQMKTAKLMTHFGAKDAEIKFYVNKPEPVASWTADWNTVSKYGDDVYDVRQTFLLPGMTGPRDVEMKVHTTNMPHADIKMYKSGSRQGDFLEAFIGFQSNVQFTAGLYNQEQGVRETLGDMNLALNTSRLLFVKFDWDARNMDTALTNLQSQLKKASKTVRQNVRAGLNEVASEVESLSERITDALPDFTPVMQVYKKEFKAIRDELKNSEESKAVVKYMEAAENVLDDYFNWVHDFTDFMSESFIVLSEQFAQFLRALPGLWEDARKMMPEWFETVKQYISDVFEGFVAMVDAVVERVKESLREIPFPQSGHLLDFLNDTSAGVGKFASEAVDSLVEAFSMAVNQFQTWLNRVFDNTPVKDYVLQVVRRYETLLASFVDNVKEKSDKLREHLLSKFPQEEMQDLILAVFEYASKKANGLDINDKAFRKDIYNKFVAAAKKASEGLWTVDTKHGLIMAQIPLPGPIESFSNLDQYNPFLKFQMSGKHWLDQVIETLGAWADSSDAYISNEINNVLTLSVSNPMQTYALLVNSEFIRTFDGKFYHFEGHCRYVLATDMQEREFTIAVDYDGSGAKPKKSIIVDYGNYQSVIRPDFSVAITKKSQSSDENTAELVAEDLEDYVTVRSTDDVLAVVCSKKQDSCIFSVSKLYHGKTKGLFGTLNSEQHDDFHSTSGNVVDKVENFVKYWKLDPTCEEKPVSTPASLKSVSGRCAEAFSKQSSPLSNCFEHVNPAQFQQICEAMETKTSATGIKPVCSTSVAYSQACAKQYRFVQPLSVC